MMTGRPLRILFLCTANSARSQLAEALLSDRADARVQASSAGTRPGECVHPLAIEELRARGIETGGLHPKSIEQAVNEMPDVVITVCDSARDECPVFPGAPLQVHWGLPDPAAVTGDDDVRRSAFRATAAVLDDRFSRLLRLRFEQMDRLELAATLRALTD
jgi:protein-tyrosine-phosphatase